MSSFWGLPLPVPVPCPKVSKFLGGRGHLPLGDRGAPGARGVGGCLGIFFRGCSRRSDLAGARMLGPCPRRGPAFCVRLGPAAPGAGGTTARAADCARRRATPAGCGGHASPGIPGLQPGGWGQKRGARSGRWAFPVAVPVPEPRVLGGAGRTRAARDAPAPGVGGGAPGRGVPRSCRPPASDPLPSQRPRTARACSLVFNPFPRKIRLQVWGSQTQSRFPRGNQVGGVPGRP